MCKVRTEAELGLEPMDNVPAPTPHTSVPKELPPHSCLGRKRVGQRQQVSRLSSATHPQCEQGKSPDVARSLVPV